MQVTGHSTVGSGVSVWAGIVQVVTYEELMVVSGIKSYSFMDNFDYVSRQEEKFNLKSSVTFICSLICSAALENSKYLVLWILIVGEEKLRIK